MQQSFVLLRIKEISAKKLCNYNFSSIPLQRNNDEKNIWARLPSSVADETTVGAEEFFIPGCVLARGRSVISKAWHIRRVFCHGLTVNPNSWLSSESKHGRRGASIGTKINEAPSNICDDGYLSFSRVSYTQVLTKYSRIIYFRRNGPPAPLSLSSSHRPFPPPLPVGLTCLVQPSRTSNVPFSFFPSLANVIVRTHSRFSILSGFRTFVVRPLRLKIRRRGEKDR